MIIYRQGKEGGGGKQIEGKSRRMGEGRENDVWAIKRKKENQQDVSSHRREKKKKIKKSSVFIPFPEIILSVFPSPTPHLLFYLSITLPQEPEETNFAAETPVLFCLLPENFPFLPSSSPNPSCSAPNFQYGGILIHLLSCQLAGTQMLDPQCPGKKKKKALYVLRKLFFTHCYSTKYVFPFVIFFSL